MEFNIQETLKSLLIKDITTEAKIDTLFRFVAQMIGNSNGKPFEVVIKEMDPVYNEFLQNKMLENPLFEDEFNSLLNELPGISPNKKQDE